MNSLLPLDISVPFNHSRVDIKAYNNLVTTKDKAAFMCMVFDYMQHVRSDRCVNDEKGLEVDTLCKFATSVTSSKTAWELAQQVEPYFQQPVREHKDAGVILQQLMVTISEYLPQPPIIHLDQRLTDGDVVFKKHALQAANIASEGLAFCTMSPERRDLYAKVVADMVAMSDVVPTVIGRPLPLAFEDIKAAQANITHKKTTVGQATEVTLDTNDDREGSDSPVVLSNSTPLPSHAGSQSNFYGHRRQRQSVHEQAEE